MIYKENANIWINKINCFGDLKNRKENKISLIPLISDHFKKFDILILIIAFLCFQSVFLLLLSNFIKI